MCVCVANIMQGIPLEEIATLFDGEDANVGGGAATSQARDHLRDMKERGMTGEIDIDIEYTEDAEMAATRNVDTSKAA